jgi:hypothetical protein
MDEFCCSVKLVLVVAVRCSAAPETCWVTLLDLEKEMRSLKLLEKDLLKGTNGMNVGPRTSG